MQHDEVVTILESLAHGQQPLVIEALTIAANALRKSRPASAGIRWSEEEDLRLGAEFDAGMKIREIAVAHGRTHGAITSRLVKLGRLDPSAVTPRERGTRVVATVE